MLKQDLYATNSKGIKGRIKNKSNSEWVWAKQ